MKHDCVCTLAKEAFPPVPERVKTITAEELLRLPDLSPKMRRWLKLYIVLGIKWAKRNNPPFFVTNEACWAKAKRAADHANADNFYEFANWWYHQYCS